MMMNSVDLYRNLRDEVGLETGWHEVGSLRLASSPERMEELARQAGRAKTFGLPAELISAEEAQRLFPPMSTDGVLGGRPNVFAQPACRASSSMRSGLDARRSDPTSCQPVSSPTSSRRLRYRSTEFIIIRVRLSDPRS